MTALPRFSELREGQRASLDRVFSSEDVADWCDLVTLGATHPWAGVPEPLIAGLFSCLLGEELPGHGTNYLKQSMAFIATADAGEPLTATVTVSRLRPDKALVNLSTRCTGRDGRLICEGEALVKFAH
ncbi:phosphate acetyltransferase [Salinarimonas sp. NSM]|uniref:phosphate acetyltransferase n=1 Tax=Salinarimonas sp. NSM TaxID=3458003 RepID=UPI0040374625